MIPSPARRALVWFLPPVVVALVVAVVVLLPDSHRDAPPAAHTHDPTARVGSDDRVPAGEPAAAPSLPAPVASRPLPPGFPAPPPGMRDSPALARLYLDSLRAYLATQDRDQHAALLRAFLNSGIDAPTGGAFSPGGDQFLRDWPTLRIAAFDDLCRIDPVSARAFADDLLAQRPADPGEWTLALREVARARTIQEWPMLAVRRFREMLHDPVWTATDAAARLEAFDLFPASRAIDLLPELDALARSPARSTAFAASLAADRLALAASVETLEELNRNVALFAGTPGLRASLFARADVRQPRQLAALEAYLRRRDVPAAEFAHFGALFPHYDLAVSWNLLTPTPSRSLNDMLAHDRAALAVLTRWVDDPVFAPSQDAVRAAERRVAALVAQAAGVDPVP